LALNRKEWSASHLGEGAHGTLCIGGWGYIKTGLDSEAKRKNPFPALAGN